MGLTQVTVRIANPTDPKRYRDLEFLVDSGAIYTVVPKKILKEIGIRPRSKPSFLLANGEGSSGVWEVSKSSTKGFVVEQP